MTTSARIAVAALLGGLLLTGCARVRYPSNYVLALPPPVNRAMDAQPVLGTAAVREFGCASYISQGRIVYRPGPEEVGFYEHHRWATDPRESITQHVAESLRNANLFAAVAPQQRGSRPDILLTGRIDRLEEVDEGKQVHAVCALSAQLTDARTGAVLWSGRSQQSLAVELRNVTGVVRSLSAAAQAAADDLTRSMTEQLRPAEKRTGR